MTVGKPNFNLNSFGVKYLSKDEVQEFLNKAPPMDMRGTRQRIADQKAGKDPSGKVTNSADLSSIHGDKPEAKAPRSSVRAHQRLNSNEKPSPLRNDPRIKTPEPDFKGIKAGMQSEPQRHVESKDTRNTAFVSNEQVPVNQYIGDSKPKPPHNTPAHSGAKTANPDEPPKSSKGGGRREVSVSRTGMVTGKDRKPSTNDGKEKPTMSKDGKKPLKTNVGATAGELISDNKNPKGNKISSARREWEKREGRGDLKTEEKPSHRASISGVKGRIRQKLSEMKGGEKHMKDHARNAFNNRHTEEGKKHMQLHDEAQKLHPSNGKDNSHLDEQYKHVTGKYYHETTNTESDETKKRKKESHDKKLIDNMETERARRSSARRSSDKKQAETAGGVDAVQNTKPKSSERSDKYDRDEDPDHEGYDHKDEDFDDDNDSTDESKTDNSESGFESEASFKKRTEAAERQRQVEAKRSRKKTPEDKKDDKKISQYDRAGVPKGHKGQTNPTQPKGKPQGGKLFPWKNEDSDFGESKKSNDIILDMNIMKLDLIKSALNRNNPSKNSLPVLPEKAEQQFQEQSTTARMGKLHDGVDYEDTPKTGSSPKGTGGSLQTSDTWQGGQEDSEYRKITNQD